MGRCKDVTTQKASRGKKQLLLHHSPPVDAEELKAGNPCLEERPGWDRRVLCLDRLRALLVCLIGRQRAHQNHLLC